MITHIRSYRRQEDVDAPADDIVTPRGVVVAVVALGQGVDTLFGRVPLLVDARAALLRRRAELLDAVPLHLRGRQRGARRGLHPGVQVGDEGVVLLDGAILVEFPECHLCRGKR